MKTLLHIILLCIPLLLFSCQKHDVENRGDEILFAAEYSAKAVPVQSDTKAATYDGAGLFETSADFESKNGMGGYFRVEAFKAGTTVKHFVQPTTVMYHTDVVDEKPDWYFYNLTDFEKRYWPQTYNLDFLAYMPLERTSDGKITQGQVLDAKTYVTHNGDRTFTCTNLPLTNQGQKDVKEFIYAWAPDKSHASTSSTNGRVPLVFKHPFAVVYIEISEAHAGTEIQSLGFKNIYNNGTFDASVESAESAESADSAKPWKVTGSINVEGLQITAGHHIPNDIMPPYTYGPFIVIPQDHVEISLAYNWNGEKTFTQILTDKKWEPGKKYTYSLKVGDSSEDVKVDVSVNEWVTGTNQEIEVK